MKPKPDTINQRVRKTILENTDNIRRFAIKYDINYNALINIVNDNRNVSLSLIIKVKTAFPHVDLNWLIMGDNYLDTP